MTKPLFLDITILGFHVCIEFSFFKCHFTSELILFIADIRSLKNKTSKIPNKF